MEMWRLWMMFGVYLLFIIGNSGLTIVGCDNGTLDVQEGTNRSFTCNGYPCTIYDSNRRILCDCSYYYPNQLCELVIYFGVSEYSYRCFKNTYTTAITRDSARMILWDNNGPPAYCTLKIAATPVYKNDSCDVSISNWTVTGSCNITGMYSSDNKYTCTWREQNNPKEEFGGWNVLVDYNVTKTRLYKSGVCSFTKPILFLNGIYTYILRVSPGSDTYYNNTIIIDSPDPVQLNHNCPSYVLEGSSVICICNASTTGSPPGFLAWYEMTNATLLLTNVSKNTSGKQFTCRLEWGSNGVIKAMISYTLTVAYGPTDVIINRIAETEEEKLGIIRFTCSAIYLYPSVKFRWNITCENQTDYTHFSLCSINITERVDDVVIECTASNTYFPQVFFSRVYDLPNEEREPESSKDSSSECVNTILVGGVGAAAIVLLIIASVLVVCIIKLQNGMAKKKDKHFSHLYAIFKRRKSQNVADHQSVSLGDIYSIAGSITADHGVDNEAFYETVQNRMTQGISGQTTAMKTMPAKAGKHNFQYLSDSLYDTGMKSADTEHNYEDFYPKGYKADTSCAKVVRCNEEEDLYENVGN